MIRILCCVLLSAFVAGCAAESVDVEDTRSEVTLGDTAVECPPDSHLSYENFGSEFLLANPGVDIVSAVYDSGPGPTRHRNEISAQERELLGEWLACGAP